MQPLLRSYRPEELPQVTWTCCADSCRFMGPPLSLLGGFLLPRGLDLYLMQAQGQSQCLLWFHTSFQGAVPLPEPIGVIAAGLPLAKKV